jgi:hypothetical protein
MLPEFTRRSGGEKFVVAERVLPKITRFLRTSSEEAVLKDEKLLLNAFLSANYQKKNRTKDCTWRRFRCIFDRSSFVHFVGGLLFVLLTVFVVKLLAILKTMIVRYVNEDFLVYHRIANFTRL